MTGLRKGELAVIMAGSGGRSSIGDQLLALASRVADWHATMALKAYRKRDYPTYTRHIRIADKLRSTA